MAAFVKNSIFAALFLILCGCKTLPNESADRYVYYVIDIHGTEPDAQFENRDDAQVYVDKFKEFHTYKIVKAQHFTNENQESNRLFGHGTEGNRNGFHP